VFGVWGGGGGRGGGPRTLPEFQDNNETSQSSGACKYKGYCHRLVYKTRHVVVRNELKECIL
jgi:hypothetical protein